MLARSRSTSTTAAVDSLPPTTTTINSSMGPSLTAATVTNLSESNHNNNINNSLLLESNEMSNVSNNSNSGSNGNNPLQAALLTWTLLWKNMSSSTFKLVLLVLMVVQNSSTVLVGRYTRAGVPKSQQYSVNHLIVVIETGKLVLSLLLEYSATHGKLYASLHAYIVQRPTDALLIAIPALLYLVQNTLLYVALSNLSAPIFQVTYQAKLVTTAVVSVFMLQRTYSVQQWTCLVALSLGVAIVVLGETASSTTTAAATTTTAAAANNAPVQSLPIGLTAVTIACFSSALAGVYFEKVLKAPTANNTVDATKMAPASLWMRNIQLSFFSIVIAVLQGMFENNKDTSATDALLAVTTVAPVTSKSYFHGFTAWAWLLVALQAGGGLLVAAVIKYADNVLKGLATGVSVVLATLVSTVLFHTALSLQFNVGAIMILAAVYYFSNPLPASFLAAVGGAVSGATTTDSAKNNNNNSSEDKVELKSLLPK